jgi:superfamily II DNA or RNA helicase
VAARLAGQNRLLVQKPTGTGKTVWFASLLDHLAELRLSKGRGAVMLVIAHREELLDQAAEKITRAHPGAMVAIEQGDRHASRYSDVVVASIQTLAAMKFRRLKKLIGQHTFRLVIVDEAHHAASKTYRTAAGDPGIPADGRGDDRQRQHRGGDP